jgi:hypothetical protein
LYPKTTRPVTRLAARKVRSSPQGQVETLERRLLFSAAVVGRHVFYNNSYFDGNDPAADTRDDSAVAPDKTALLPGGTATFANYTSYDKGLNGVMIDVAGLPQGAAPGADDFLFKVGNDGNPAGDGWSIAPPPRGISVRPGAGVDGSDRITIVWDDHAIQKQWLRATMLPSVDTALESPDVFYFGNAVGDDGNSATDARVTAADELGARAHPRTSANPAPVDDRYDYNRDRMVNVADQLIARRNHTTVDTALKLIAAPAREALEDFRNVPDVYAYDPARFAALWQTARTDTVRLALFGDSQETSPSGVGLVYVPRVNYEFWREYGNVPETQLVGHGSYGNTNPPADWLLRGNINRPGPSPTRVSADRLPPFPMPGPAAHSTKRSDRNVNGQAFGQFTTLLHDGAALDAGAQIPAGVNYFDPHGVVRAQLFAHTHPSSGEVAYKARPINPGNSPYYSAVTTAGTLELGLESATPGVRSGWTEPLNYAGKRYMNVEVHGSQDAKLTDVLGLRYHNDSRPEGVTVMDLAAGGHTSASILAGHANAGDVFAALGFHAAVIHYGANDINAGFSAEQFRQNTLALMAAVRSWTNDPHFKFILIADTDKASPGGERRVQYDRYVGAHFDIASRDPDVMVVNARRLMHAIGWDASKPTFWTFSTDGVHHTAEGARRLAEAEVRAMVSVGGGPAGAAVRGGNVARSRVAPVAGVRPPGSLFASRFGITADRAASSRGAAAESNPGREPWEREADER